MISGDGKRFIIYQAQQSTTGVEVINRANYAFMGEALGHWKRLMTARDKNIRDARAELLKNNIEKVIGEINEKQDKFEFKEEADIENNNTGGGCDAGSKESFKGEKKGGANSARRSKKGKKA